MVVLWIALSVNSKQLRNIGRAKYIVCPTNPTVCRATALPAHYVPAPLENAEYSSLVHLTYRKIVREVHILCS